MNWNPCEFPRDYIDVVVQTVHQGWSEDLDTIAIVNVTGLDYDAMQAELDRVADFFRSTARASMERAAARDLDGMARNDALRTNYSVKARLFATDEEGEQGCVGSVDGICDTFSWESGDWAAVGIDL